MNDIVEDLKAHLEALAPQLRVARRAKQEVVIVLGFNHDGRSMLPKITMKGVPLTNTVTRVDTSS